MNTFRSEEETLYRNVFENMQEVLYLCDNEERTTQIVKSLGDFSRKGEEQSVKGDLPDIEFYPGKLNQVFMNILTLPVKQSNKPT